MSHWRFETLSLFRIKKVFKYTPCLGQNPQIYYPVWPKGHVHCLRQTCKKLYTLFRTDSHKIDPLQNRKDENHTLSSGTSPHRPYKTLTLTLILPPPPRQPLSSLCPFSYLSLFITLFMTMVIYCFVQRSLCRKDNSSSNDVHFFWKSWLEGDDDIEDW